MRYELAAPFVCLLAPPAAASAPPGHSPLPSNSFVFTTSTTPSRNTLLFNELHTPGGRGYPIMVNWVSDEDTHPACPERQRREQAQRADSSSSRATEPGSRITNSLTCRALQPAEGLSRIRHMLTGDVSQKCRRADIFPRGDFSEGLADVERIIDSLNPGCFKRLDH